MHEERAVIVTGGASGIGLGISKLFAANGHPVAILDMQEAALEREASAMRAAGGRVIGLTRSLAREFGGRGITVNTIPCSLVDTPLARAGEKAGQVPPLEVIAQHIPVPRPGTPADIAHACAFLCSEQASYITGQEINVNGGSWM